MAALVHDEALLEDPGLISAVTAAIRLTADNERLRRELQERLDELAASRVRIIEAADAERRRIERDLHDGAQQRLISIALQLRLALARRGGRRTPDVECRRPDRGRGARRTSSTRCATSPAASTRRS